ncbi:TMV resistance protein N-like [Bidens hawaiensis]|uniref:TMV resistance protein N-like n=1 Tax=Bidens hawaiensis TaxID=980011 RepID=UPI00404ACE2E
MTGGRSDWPGPTGSPSGFFPELLGEMEAIGLFCKYAFKANTPPIEFEEVSLAVVRHTGHLPLALKVLGSHFHSRNLDFWKSELKVLTKIPHDEVNGNLKLSYDGLNILQKKIFLYVACFFKGKGRHLVTRILDAVGFEAVSGITVLIEKSLLSISEGVLHMHDLIQEMGQCIVRECYPNMVWVPEEIKEVMTTINRLEAVEAMVLPINSYLGISYNAELLKSMKKLRLLDVKDWFTSSEPTGFPEQLRWLNWFRYPFDSLRITRDMTNLVGLNMAYGQVRRLHIENKIILPNLKFIDLRNSKITMFPSVSGVPNLEWLNLFKSNLVEIDKSVFLHGKIIYLNLSFCTFLETLPLCIKMKSLHTLLLNDCLKLKTFPEFSPDMEKLSVLHMHTCNSMRELSPSIRLFTGLTSLFAGGSVAFVTEKEDVIQGLLHCSSLRALDLSRIFLDDSFPSNLHTAWPLLEEFLLFNNFFTRLPATISQLSHLKYLDLSYCDYLKDLPVLPSLIQVLKASRCRSLQKIGDLSKMYKWLFKISIWGCPELLMDTESQSHIAKLLMKSLVQNCATVNHRLSIMVPGSKIPYYFSNRRSGNKIEVYIPQNQISKMIGLAICCSLPPTRSILTIKFKPSDEEKLISGATHPAKTADFMWIGYMSIDILGRLCHDFESEKLTISFALDMDDIIECGVFVIYKDDVKTTTKIGSWISDYDELGKINRYSASTTGEQLQHGRWPIAPNLLFQRKTSDHNSFRVFV